MQKTLAALLVLLVPAASFAAPKYTKKESEITASQTELTKPQQKAKDDKKKPTLSADDVFGGVGEKVKSITESQINVLKRLIDNTGDADPEKPDYLFRLAELYNEQQHYYNFRARELDQKIFEAKDRGDQAGANKLTNQQADYQKKENTWLLAAVKAYIAVAEGKEYTAYKRMDEVLFYLAYLLTQVKKEEAARKYFKRLIKDYPQSKYIADAYLSFGEYFFDNKDIENALKFYEKVLQYPQSRVYGYALYKTGWCYFNLSDFKKALTTFVEVIKMTQAGRGAGNKANRIALEKEAKKDSVRAYAQIGVPEKAWDFFKNIGGDYAMTMEEMLGELYNSQGKFLDSIKIYRQLMSLAPTSPKLCIWEAEVVKNTLSTTGSKADATTVKELQRLSAIYDKVEKEGVLKKGALEECRDATSNTIRELATVWHKEAQKTNNNDTYALAQYLYREYINRFPKEKDILVMTFYYAELLFKLGTNGENQKFCEAAPIYTKVVELDPSPKGKYLRESAYAAVISWKNCLAVEDSAEDAKSGQVEKRNEKKNAGEKEAEQVFAPKPIPDRWLKMLGAFDTYIKYVPDSPELCTIKYRKARVFYEYNHIDEAVPLFKDVVDTCKTSDLAVYSVNLLFDCLAMKKQYTELRGAIDVYCKVPELVDKDPTFKQQCGTLKLGLLRKEIEVMEKEKKYKEAGTLYLMLANEYPDDPKIDEVYYNAAVDFERMKLVGLAIQARKALIEKKPDSTLAKKAIYLIGRNYQDIAAFEAASENYEVFSAKYPGEKDASTALFTASFFRRGLGQNDKAIEDANLFIKNYGGRKDFIDKAAGVQFGLGQIYLQQKESDKYEKHLRDYLKNWGTKGGVDRQVLAHVLLGEIAWRNSCPVKGVNGACIEVQRVRSSGAERVKAKEAKALKGKKKKKKGANLPPQCGPATKSKIIVHDRKPAPIKEALGHFAEALKLFKGGAASKSVPGKDEQEKTDRSATMAYYAAQARMMEGDIEYEKFLRIAIPDKLDFSPAAFDASAAKKKAAEKRIEESKKKFKTWLDSKTKQLDTAQKIYQNVILFKQAHWAIAAAARIGQLFQDFSGQLYTAPVPKAPPAPSGVEADEWEQMFHDSYCDQMTDAAEPLEKKAVDGLGTCLNKSTDLSWFNEWSKLCEEELNQIEPASWPIAAEIRAEPGYSTTQMDRAVVQPLESKP